MHPPQSARNKLRPGAVCSASAAAPLSWICSPAGGMPLASKGTKPTGYDLQAAGPHRLEPQPRMGPLMGRHQTAALANCRLASRAFCSTARLPGSPCPYQSLRHVGYAVGVRNCRPSRLEVDFGRERRGLLGSCAAYTKPFISYPPCYYGLIILALPLGNRVPEATCASHLVQLGTTRNHLPSRRTCPLQPNGS